MTAAENYYYYLQKYNDADYRLRLSESKEAGYVSQRNAKRSELNNAKTKRNNAKKRLEDVEKLVKMMEGAGGWFSTNVPDKISDAQRSLDKLDNSFHKSMKLTGGRGGTADLKVCFRVKSVQADGDSDGALRSFKNEKSRLETEITQTERTINALNSSIDQLSAQIRTCNSEQSTWRRNRSYYLAQVEIWRRRVIAGWN